MCMGAKFERSGFVMVTFMHQFDWVMQYPYYVSILTIYL